MIFVSVLSAISKDTTHLCACCHFGSSLKMTELGFHRGSRNTHVIYLVTSCQPHLIYCEYLTDGEIHKCRFKSSCTIHAVQSAGDSSQIQLPYPALPLPDFCSPVPRK